MSACRLATRRARGAVQSLDGCGGPCSKAWTAVVALFAFAEAVGAEEELAARYPADASIVRDPAVLFFDDFETGDLSK